MKTTAPKQCMSDRNHNKLCLEVFRHDEEKLLSVVQFNAIPEKYEDVVRKTAAECFLRCSSSAIPPLISPAYQSKEPLASIT